MGKRPLWQESAQESRAFLTNEWEQGGQNEDDAQAYGACACGRMQRIESWTCMSVKKKKKKKVDRRGVGGKRKREREKQGEEAV